jgi:hypothetical protein
MATLSEHAVDRFYERGRVVGAGIMNRLRRKALAQNRGGEYAVVLWLPKPVRDWTKPGKPTIHAAVAVIENDVVVTFSLMSRGSVDKKAAYMPVLH